MGKLEVNQTHTANITCFLMLQQHFPCLCERRGYSMNKVNAIASGREKNQPNNKPKTGRKKMVWREMFGCKKHPRVVAQKYSYEKSLQLPKWNPNMQVDCTLLSCKQLCFNIKVKQRTTNSYKLDNVCTYIISAIVPHIRKFQEYSSWNTPTPSGKNNQTWAVLKDLIFWSDKQLNG